MDKGTALNRVRQFRESLEEAGLQISRVILFGSHATGKAREDSDLDLVVVSPDFAGEELWNRLERIASPIWEMHTPMEVIPVTPEEWEEDSSIKELVAGGLEL